MIAQVPAASPEVMRAATTPNLAMPPVPDAATPERIVAKSVAESGARDFTLWNKEVVPFARDLLFILGIFAYLIGFAHHTSKMARFGMETQLADQPLTSLFTWAVEAIHDGSLGFAAIFSLAAAFLLFAGFLKYRFARITACRAFVYGIVTFAIIGGLVLSFSWSSAVGICNADRTWNTDTKLEKVLFRLNPQVKIPAFNSVTPPPAFLLAETNDGYQILVTQPFPDRSIAMIVPRSEVISVEYAPPLESDARIPKHQSSRSAGPSNVATPDPGLSGPDTPDNAIAGEASPSCSFGMNV